MSDIECDADIEKLVHLFYKRIQEDELLKPAFTTAMEIDWSIHLPRMVDFWRTVIFRIPAFKGNPFLKHLMLSRRTEITQAHFEQWVELFHKTADDLFIGENADVAKQSATQMGRGMSHNLFAKSEVYRPIL